MKQKLRNLKMKWRRAATIEAKMRANWTDRESIAKSYGMDIGFSLCASDLERLLKELK